MVSNAFSALIGPSRLSAVESSWKSKGDQHIESMQVVQEFIPRDVLQLGDAQCRVNRRMRATLSCNNAANMILNGRTRASFPTSPTQVVLRRAA